ncbi:cytochrome c3 family protein [Trichlorobacter lovleyi]|nr:cytochrome c3 family protein [Trichlorobacter lovleyi]
MSAALPIAANAGYAYPTLKCTNCHQSHDAFKNFCATCHGFAFSWKLT